MEIVFKYVVVDQLDQPPTAHLYGITTKPLIPALPLHQSPPPNVYAPTTKLFYASVLIGTPYAVLFHIFCYSLFRVVDISTA